jgi:hypothetical protein
MKINLPIIPRRHHRTWWFQLLRELGDYLEALATALSWLLIKVVIPLVEGLLTGLFGSSSRRGRGRL